MDSFINKNKDQFKYFGGDIDTFVLNCRTVH